MALPCFAGPLAADGGFTRVLAAERRRPLLGTAGGHVRLLVHDGHDWCGSVPLDTFAGVCGATVEARLCAQCAGTESEAASWPPRHRAEGYQAGDCRFLALREERTGERSGRLRGRDLALDIKGAPVCAVASRYTGGRGRG